jgi:hypothetical protein
VTCLLVVNCSAVSMSNLLAKYIAVCECVYVCVCARARGWNDQCISFLPTSKTSLFKLVLMRNYDGLVSGYITHLSFWSILLVYYV